MTLNRDEWYFVLFVIVLIALIGLNEIGYGAIAFLPLMLVEVCLIRKIYGKEKPSD